MSAFAALLRGHDRASELRVLSASGQLGYGILEPAFRAGLARKPHLIGADMGSVDPGPYYLGAGVMATDPGMTRRDLRLILTGARALGVPLLLGTAGTAGAAPHLEATLAMIREIAAEEGLHFRLASIAADMDPALVADSRITPLGRIPVPSRDDILASRIVGQMGVEAFGRALDAGADVIIAGRACDTAIFATIPMRLGYPAGLSMHMAKIIECTSLCCRPGGRDAMLATLTMDDFVLESMNPDRHATPSSVAAHALYEQGDPYMVAEPEGVLHLDTAQYAAVDDHRTRVFGARWEDATAFRVKIEGAQRIGHRALLLAASADPAFIARLPAILAAVEATTRSLFPGAFDLYPRIYGQGGVSLFGAAPREGEVFILTECVAETLAMAKGALSVFKQYLLHHGFEGRVSTGGNIAFPLTPPEVDAGPSFRFSLYHLMDVGELAPLFPVMVEEV